MSVCVLKPGVQTTVQDLGRPGHSAIGVPRSGAADDVSLRLGNRLVGNADSAAGLEMAVLGALLRFEASAWIVLAGEAEAVVRQADGATSPLVAWQCVEMEPGSQLEVGRITWGLRAYLCIRGGVDVPRVLGSRSTHVAAALGGWQGRPIAVEDVLPVGPATSGSTPCDKPSRGDVRAFVQRWVHRDVARVVPGLHADRLPQEACKRLWSSSWKVLPQSDRMGTRLDGPTLRGAAELGRLPSEGMPPGAVQVPPDGRPIVLGPDGPTTGGYPVIANVVTVDQPVVAQWALGANIGFRAVTLEEARALFSRRESELQALVPSQSA